MYLETLPQIIKPVLLSSAAANAVTCDTVSLKNVLKFWWLIFHAGANDTDLVLTPTQATDVASGTNKATSAVHRIWKDVDAGTTSDTLVAQTAAASLTIDPATENPVLAIIEVDPALHLDVAGGYDCVYLADSGGHASNTVRIFGLALMKDQGQGALGTSIIID
jgi:hypothetical protein